MSKKRCPRKSASHRLTTTTTAATAEALEPRLLLAAQMVADLTTGTPGSSPSSMVDVNGTMFFIADDGVHGRELWKSDGTADGTVLVKDIKPGTGSGLASAWLINFNGRAFFMADDGVNGAELWRSDGTPEGTILVKDIFAGTAGSNPGKRLGDDERTRLVVGDTLYFAANGGTGNELWKTDGTRRGTVLVKDIKPGSGSSDPHQMTAVNGQLVFVANSATQTRLFRSDGTDVGTYDLGAPFINPYQLTASGPYVYFTSTDQQNWNVLARTDGTVAGTTTVGTVGGGISSLVDLNGRPVFLVWYSSSGAYDLYAMDPASSALGRVIAAGSGATHPEYLTPVNGAVYFSMVGNGLWKSDGTAAGTVQISTAQPDTANGWPRQFVRYGSNGFTFYGADGAGGRALWTSDGTTQGTTLVKTLDLPAPDYTNVAPLLAIGQSIYVVANLPDSGAELWRSDGTASGTVPLKDVNQLGVGSNPVPGAELNGRLYFAGGGGSQLWSSDGTAGGTQRVTGLFAAGAAASPADFLNIAGVLYFTGGQSGYSDRLLYRTDGTPGGSYALRPAGGNGPGAPRELADVNGTLFFSGFDPNDGFELWKTDGTVAGTVMLTDAYPGIGLGDPRELTALGGTLIYAATTGTQGRELWVSDGTPAGTVLLDDLWPGTNSSNPRELTRLGDAVYFLADGPEGTTYLWKTDGTAAGTLPVVSLTGTLPSSLVAANGLLFFLRSDPDTGREVWATDGTPQGTRLVRDIVPGPGSSKISGLFAVGGSLFFQANDVDHGAELWRSDGTAAGTTMVTDAVPGPDGSNALPAFDANGLLILTATDPTHGTELWRSDGSGAGTSLIADINPGPESSAPGKFAIAGGVLYFAATDGAHGNELWKLPDIPPTGTTVTDVTPPRVTRATFDEASPIPVGPVEHVVVRFSEDVGALLSLADVKVRNLTTGQELSPVSLTYDPKTNAALIDLGSAIIPDGNYVLTIGSADLADAAGNPLDGDDDGQAGGDFTFDFFVLAGDANRDRLVSFTDLLALARNYNKDSGATWADGDFDGNGTVNFSDLLTLARNYNKTLPASGAAPAPAAAMDVQALAAGMGMTVPAVTPPTVTASPSPAPPPPRSKPTVAAGVTKPAPKPVTPPKLTTPPPKPSAPARPTTPAAPPKPAKAAPVVKSGANSVVAKPIRKPASGPIAPVSMFSVKKIAAKKRSDVLA